MRVFPFHSLKQASMAGVLAAIGLAFAACSEPTIEKPIPPLDPSLAVEKPSAEPEPEPTSPPKPGSITRMPLGNLYQLVQREAALIYDVRPTLYYKMGHVPGAISFPTKDFEKDFSKHEDSIRTANRNNTPVVLYCTDLACPDATNVATKLSQRGYDVSILQGGYEAWKVAAD